MTGVGFEPTPPKRLVPKTSALDHSANQSFTVMLELRFLKFTDAVNRTLIHIVLQKPMGD